MKNNNLGTFKVLYIIKGCLLAFSTLFVFAYIIFLSFFLNNADIDFHQEIQGTEDLAFNPLSMIQLIKSIGFILAFIFLAFVVCNFLAANYISKTKNYYFIFVIAILNCFTGILGILLGVFTLVEISKPKVKTLFFSEPEKLSEPLNTQQ